jgi:ABC-type uncharacterized transport system auxiliary subunit
MNIEPVWHSVNTMRMATKSALESYDRNKIVAKLKNGQIEMYQDVWESEDIKEVFFLP